MPRRDPDVFQTFESAIAARELTSPWIHTGGQPQFVPDIELLSDVVGVPVKAKASQTSGRFAKAIDAWCAHELRRAGFDRDEVWPRATAPRVLPRDIVTLLANPRLSNDLRETLEKLVLENAAVTPVEATILGRAYEKQVDVLIADWSRGAELVVSTKSTLSSFRNNLKNRFEEAYGDAKNLRGRFPQASMGFLLLVRSTISPGDTELFVDMIRKLREEDDVYDATALIVARWEDPFDKVTVVADQVPVDVGPSQFLETLIARVLARTPVQFHVRVRELREKRVIPVAEGESGAALDR